MRIECTRCGEKVNAELLKSYVTFDERDLCDLRFSFLKCPECNGPILTYQYPIGKGRVDDRIKAANWDEPYLIYPQIFKEISNSVPKPLINAYLESVDHYNARKYDATTTTCRKILEGICRFHNIETENLKSDLEEMKNKGIIESRLFKMAEAIRLEGNRTAHWNKETSSKQDAHLPLKQKRKDAKAIIEFTYALLEYLFTIDGKIKDFNEGKRILSDRNDNAN